MKNTFFLFLLSLGLLACSDPRSEALFREVDPEISGIDFVNEIQESPELNILTDEFMYNGGGIGVGDFNLDGLYDLYFTANLVPNKLYLNDGYMKFREVTDVAGVAAADIWSSGVSVVDINQDGRPDIYVSATFHEEKEKRINKLFINEGNNEAGIPQFSEQAAKFGLADTSYNTHSYFFDYDKDGDLDVFLLNDKLFSPRSTTDLKLLMEGEEAATTIDKLYKNNGENFYTDVSQEAGINELGFGLGAAIIDANGDRWYDIYVSNDFISNDVLYINQKNGTFKNEIQKHFKHHSFSSMGIDAADLNKDGKSDLMTLDMLPENRARVKRTYGFQKFQFYDLMQKNGYLLQYNRNSLQMSNLDGRYSEVSELLGLDASEWSWSVLFADFDNDGQKDLAISNGYPRDITDMDFADYNSGANRLVVTKEKLLAQIPTVKVPNYFFQNTGEGKFENVSQAWGISKPSFSNGAVIADLDNDGDLDYVVNNINDPAQLYENRTNSQSRNNVLRLYLQGEKGNQDAIGAKVQIYYDGKTDISHQLPQRGYISSIEPGIHFGIGRNKRIDSVLIYWPEGDYSLIKDIPVEGLKELRVAKNRLNTFVRLFNKHTDSTFVRLSIPGLDFDHQEINFFDYNFQALLPRMHSREGPGMAVGDINGDGKEDLLIGNGSRASTKIFFATNRGAFREDSLTDIRISEDQGLLLFDADGDRDLDLYIGSGSTEFRKGSKYFHDKFYLNDGKGNFSFSPDRIPPLPISTASVSAADYDKDGDLDLFLAGRIDPQNYPHPSNSYLLENEGGNFSIANDSHAPVLNQIGMLSQGLWTDFDQDGWTDLILAGEWMPITLLQNKEGKFEEIQNIPQSSGWWNSISAADLDNDGDTDYILGNQGLNNKLKASPEHPLLIYAKDFDQNGSVDPIIAQYQQDAYYPVHLKLDLTRQLVKLKRKYAKYEAYASAKMEDIFPADSLEAAKKLQAEHFASSILWNDAEGFRLEALPQEAQIAPIYNSYSLDIDGDADLDILLQGNRYSTEVFEGRHDASNGLLLINEGNGQFVYKGNKGFLVDADARSLVRLQHESLGTILISGINDESPIIFGMPAFEHKRTLLPQEGDLGAMMVFKNGKKRWEEFYIGSSFLSQSSSQLLYDPEMLEEISIKQADGTERKIELQKTE